MSVVLKVRLISTRIFSVISQGAYRDAWLVETRAKDDWVLKMARYDRHFGGKELDLVQKDAVVMEKLSSSPRIVDMYGHCAASLNVEAMDNGLSKHLVPRKHKKKREEWDHFVKDVKSRTKNVTYTKKLGLAIEMAESIAELHGYENGVIVHDDVHLAQWMRAKDGALKVGDFNRAIIVDWDEEKQEYCKFSRTSGVRVSAARYPKKCRLNCSIISYLIVAIIVQ